jgi:hypothetical protein
MESLTVRRNCRLLAKARGPDTRKNLQKNSASPLFPAYNCSCLAMQQAQNRHTSDIAQF